MAESAKLLDNGMLPDGSNPEGVDPSPPLNWKGKGDFTNVIFYGVDGSPPSTKIRTYLTYYGIPFERKSGGGKPGSDYKKMPVLDVASRQVNDSAVIIKFLVPALAGSFDEEFEKEVTYKFQPSIEVSLDSNDFKLWAMDPHGFGLGPCMAACVGPIIQSQLINKNIQKGFDDPNQPNEKIDPFAWLTNVAKQRGSQTFFGGAEPGQKDLSLYGTIALWMYKKCPTVVGMVDSAGLQPWWDAMSQKVPGKDLFPGVS